MKKHERADTDGEKDRGTDGTDSDDKSIAGHAKDHSHEGHDGTQADPHSQPQHGKHHKNMAGDK